MIKIGITGQVGFVGTHLYNTLGFYPEKFSRIPFEDQFFEIESRLKAFAKQCDVIVHLAAMNRHGDPQVIYDTNIRLVKHLIGAMEATSSKPHVLFSSSTQEVKDNPYGKSKKEGRDLLEAWAERNGAKFTGLIIPNIFGPFGNPYYNSVVATFCHQLTHNETPKIEVDGELKLIYVDELVKEILDRVTSQQSAVSSQKICHTSEIKVSALLDKLEKINKDYFETGIIPDLSNHFDRNLFNTFLCYIDHQSFFPFKLKKNSDDRGSFVESIKLNNGGQVSFSTTVPGTTRGNHFHTRKAERFVVIKGQARIELRKIGTHKIMTFDLDGDQPAYA
jgi:UDP-2-acetamido-2,6-beta-L-arabino-hexul-4-ose reductase